MAGPRMPPSCRPASLRCRHHSCGGVSPPDSPSRADRSFRREPIYPACMRGFGGEAPRLAPAVSSGSDHLAGRATEWGRLPRGGGRGQRPPPRGSRGPRGPKGGGAAAAHWLPTRPPSTGAAAERMVLSGCTVEDFRQGCRAMIVLSGCTGEEDWTAGLGAVPRWYPVDG